MIWNEKVNINAAALPGHRSLSESMFINNKLNRDPAGQPRHLNSSKSIFLYQEIDTIEIQHTGPGTNMFLYQWFWIRLWIGIQQPSPGINIYEKHWFEIRNWKGNPADRPKHHNETISFLLIRNCIGIQHTRAGTNINQKQWFCFIVNCHSSVGEIGDRDLWKDL